MTTKEKAKAKAYDEALERARQIKNGENGWRYSDLIEIGPALTEIFPELAEKVSEEDKIRREMTDFVQLMKRKIADGMNGIAIRKEDDAMFDKFLAYLEKQKEKARIITANLLEDGITGVQRELIEFLANNIDASWVDIIKSADAYAQRIKSMFEKQKEQNPNIEHIQRSWYMEGYTDRKHWREPRWIIKTDDGGPRYEDNPNYGEMVSTEETELNAIAFLEQLGYTCIPEGGKKPAEWSEEDENKLRHALFNTYAVDTATYLFNKLKTLRPQPKVDSVEYERGFLAGQGSVSHWKPSEEQMEWLESAVKLSTDKPHIHGIIISLYEQLKRLMEE